METRSVSRCVAIAAHGKRCQQSPFRGSPYCWHHTQSRKIWAPSRPLGSPAPMPRTGGPAEPAPEDEGRTGIDRRARADRRAAWTPENVREGAFLILRDESGVFTERSVADRPARQRRTA